MKVAIVGAGGVGGYFGGLLARAGHEVTYLARGPHLEAILRNGCLRVESQNDGDFFAPGRSEWDPETLEERPFDIERARQTFRDANRRFAAARQPAH